MTASSSELSTGVRRMVDLGVQLANEPSVLLLDEPSSGIASKETEALGPTLKAVQAHLGCSLLIIEHDMPLVRALADRLVALDTGAVVADGHARRGPGPPPGGRVLPRPGLGGHALRGVRSLEPFDTLTRWRPTTTA